MWHKNACVSIVHETNLSFCVDNTNSNITNVAITTPYIDNLTICIVLQVVFYI